jgi:hypothetical protein
MRNLKKLLLLPALFVFIAFSSCSKDDPKPTVVAIPIEGKWQFDKEGEIVGSEEILDDYSHSAGCTKDYTEILPGNVIKDHYFDNPDCQETIDTGTWFRNGNSFLLSYPGETALNATILALTYTTLKIKVTVEDGTRVVVLKRIG